MLAVREESVVNCKLSITHDVERDELAVDTAEGSTAEGVGHDAVGVVSDAAVGHAVVGSAVAQLNATQCGSVSQGDIHLEGCVVAAVHEGDACTVKGEDV